MPDDLTGRLRRTASLTPFARLLIEAADCIQDLQEEIDRLHSWAGLLSILDECYPASIFLGLGPGVDPGPQIIALLRRINQLRTSS